MDPEIIDWSCIVSVFVEDETYENINAPKWVDLSAPNEFVDDEAWFCTPKCKHPKCAEDFIKSKRNPKVNILRSVSISEILPFRDRNRRTETSKRNEAKSSSKILNSKKLNFHQNSHGNSENANPNISTPRLSMKRENEPKKAIPIRFLNNDKKMDEPHTTLPKNDRKPKLRNAFSARNLLGGRDILGQISEFCSELKNMAKRKPKKGTPSENVLSHMKEREREKERTPLLVVKEGKVLREL